jgi:hypothetical protein
MPPPDASHARSYFNGAAFLGTRKGDRTGQEPLRRLPSKGPRSFERGSQEGAIETAQRFMREGEKLRDIIAVGGCTLMGPRSYERGRRAELAVANSALGNTVRSGK